MKKFLNRLLGLKIALQTLLFNYFHATLKAVISTAKTEGLYTEGISDVPAKSIVSRSNQGVLWVDPVTQLTTFKNGFVIDRGVSFHEACQLLELGRGLEDASGFYKSRRLYFGSYLYLLGIQRTGKKITFKIYRPNTGASSLQMTEDQLREHYARIQPQEAEAGWTEKFKDSLEVCVHGNDCQQGESGKVNKPTKSKTDPCLGG